MINEKGGETNGKESFYTKDSELKSAFYSNKSMFVLLYKETFLNINDLDSSSPSVVSSLLQEFKYVILEDDPKGLPLEEIKELKSQVEELISPCVLHVLLEPKKMDCGGCVFIFILATTLWLRFEDESFRGRGE